MNWFKTFIERTAFIQLLKTILICREEHVVRKMIQSITRGLAILLRIHGVVTEAGSMTKKSASGDDVSYFSPGEVNYWSNQKTENEI